VKLFLAIVVSNYSPHVFERIFQLFIGNFLANLLCDVTICAISSLFEIKSVLVNSVCSITIFVSMISLVSGVLRFLVYLDCSHFSGLILLTSFCFIRLQSLNLFHFAIGSFILSQNQFLLCCSASAFIALYKPFQLFFESLTG